MLAAAKSIVSPTLIPRKKAGAMPRPLHIIREGQERTSPGGRPRMKGGQRSFLRHIETLFDAGTIGEQTDRQLLERFTGRDRTAAELAFTVLVRRHGPMVFRACRAILGDAHAAEDAFQATFLVLARKAAGLWARGSLGPWLLAVACRTASCARIAASRRQAHDRKAAERTPIAVEDQPPDDRNTILHQELNRLPEKYRA